MRELCIPTPGTISYPRDGWNKSTPACGYWFQNRDKPGKDAPVATTHLDHVLQVVTRGCFHLLGDPGKYNCALSIIDTRRMEAGTYFFQMESGNAEYNYLYDLLSLHVRDMKLPTRRTRMKHGGPIEPECCRLNYAPQIHMLEPQPPM